MINTDTKIKNLEGEFFENENKKGEKYPLTVGDVLLAEINRAQDIELKMSWQLMTLFSKHNFPFSLNEEQKKVVKGILEGAAKRSYKERFNLAIYGFLNDWIDDPKLVPEDCQPEKK